MLTRIYWLIFQLSFGAESRRYSWYRHQLEFCDVPHKYIIVIIVTYLRVKLVIDMSDIVKS